ncbi:MFS transporter [Microlunatus flavus]|uniref:MFS-type transporter involved in bile tolerance, Atg22 family n=1 Tax=Microlunatus flavus TaxID=1036181 RepID=A0A1H9DEZ3_9ACTN|nr:MFS transporter [Microlunatus flavus]SEQ12046.1 MFS-type transporter involved in bile tolerance, Atg22 family [Microlunatus flavus]
MYVSLRNAPKSATPAASPASAAGVVPTAEDHEAARSGKAGRRVPGVVLALGLTSLFTDISSEAVTAILPLYVTAVLGLGPAAYGFVDGIYQGASSLVRVLGGWWSDRSGRPKLVAFLGYGVSALSRFLLLPVTGVAALTGVVALDRLGKGLRTGPRDAMIAGASTPERLGRNFGVHRALDTAGAVAGPLLAFGVLSAVPAGLAGYRAVFVLSIAAAVAGLAVLLLAVPNRARGRAEAQVLAAADAAADGAAEPVAAVPPERWRWRNLADRRLRSLLLAASLLGLLTVGDGFLYLVLADAGGIGLTYFPLLMVGTNAAYFALAVPIGRLADRIGRARVLVGGHVVLVAAYVVAATTGAHIAGVVAVLALLGCFYAATDGVVSALASQAVPASSRATGIASVQTAVGLSRFVSSVGFGLLWQLTSRSTALLAVGLALALAVPVAARLLRGLRTPVPQDAS